MELPDFGLPYLTPGQAPQVADRSGGAAPQVQVGSADRAITSDSASARSRFVEPEPMPIFSSDRRRHLARVSVGVSLVIGSLLSVASVADAQIPPPCHNYVHREEAGSVEVDMRFDPKTGAFSTLAVFWFINDPGAQPGIYNWSHLVNGRSLTPRIDLKDDNFHTTFRAADGWKYGDTYKLQATHYSNVTQTTYIAAVNECTLVPR
ncbi:MAG: hypothetical protein ACT4RN_09840 [Pseudonocardia sp.]